MDKEVNGGKTKLRGENGKVNALQCKRTVHAESDRTEALPIVLPVSRLLEVEPAGQHCLQDQSIATTAFSQASSRIIKYFPSSREEEQLS